MEQPRKEQLSIYYWLRELFAPTFINVVDEFPQDELVLPTIAIITIEDNARPFQLGGSDLDKRSWTIYVYAKNSGQRDDYLSLIKRSLESGVCVYNYDEGFPPDVAPTQVGSLYVESRKSKPLRVYEDLVKKKYWSGVVMFTTYFNATT
jgi:hypothetical protein